MSVALPAVNGTMAWIGLTGQFCALACARARESRASPPLCTAAQKAPINNATISRLRYRNVSFISMLSHDLLRVRCALLKLRRQDQRIKQYHPRSNLRGGLPA